MNKRGVRRLVNVRSEDKVSNQGILDVHVRFYPDVAGGGLKVPNTSSHFLPLGLAFFAKVSAEPQLHCASY